MSDPPPTKPKVGSLRDRIAAFENKGGAPSPAPAPVPRPKPGGVSWKPKAPSPPTSPATATEEEKKAAGMSASDAKESIGMGGSLKERMAALKGRGAFGGFGGPPAPAPKPEIEKPKWKPPPVVSPPIDDDAGSPITQPSEVTETKVSAPDSKVDDDNGAAPQDPSTSEPVKENESSELDAIEVDPEEEERQRRAALAARMARLGGARVGMGPPIFGKNPDSKKVTSPASSTQSSEHPTVIPKAEPTEVPSAEQEIESDVTKEAKSSNAPSSEQTDIPKPKEIVVSEGPAEQDPETPKAPEAKATSTSAVQEPVVTLSSPPEEASSLSHPNPSSVEDQDSPALSSRSPPLSMPVPLGPRRTAPPRRRAAKSPAPPASAANDENKEDHQETQKSVPAEPEASAPQEVPETSNAPVEAEIESEHADLVPTPSQQPASEEGPIAPLQPSSNPPEEAQHSLSDVPDDMSTTGVLEAIPPQDQRAAIDNDDDPDVTAALVDRPAGQQQTDDTPAHHTEDTDVKLHPSESVSATELAPESAQLPSDSEQVTQLKLSDVESEEDEEKRRRRIAERLAKIGGFNPFGAPKSFSVLALADPLAEDGESGDVASSIVNVPETILAMSESDQKDLRRLSKARVLEDGEVEQVFISESIMADTRNDAPSLDDIVDSHDADTLRAMVAEPDPTSAANDILDTHVVGEQPPLPPPRPSKDQPAADELHNTVDPHVNAGNAEVDSESQVPTQLAQSHAQELPSTVEEEDDYDLSTALPPHSRSAQSDSGIDALNDEAQYHLLPSPAPPALPAHGPPEAVSENYDEPNYGDDHSSPMSSPHRVVTDAHVGSEAANIVQEFAPLDAGKDEGDEDMSDSNVDDDLPPPLPAGRHGSMSQPQTLLGHDEDTRHDKVGEDLTSPPADEKASVLAHVTPAHKQEGPPPPPSRAAPPPKLDLHDEEEVLSDSEGDPIDPRFIPRSPKTPSPSHTQSLHLVPTHSTPSVVSAHPDHPETSEPSAESSEDPEAARRRTIAERMAKLGGIRFGAPPPVHRPPKAASPPPDAETGTGTVTSDTAVPEQTEEEDEEARRARIRAKLAGMGGVGFGGFAPSIPKPASGSDRRASHDNLPSPPQRPLRPAPDADSHHEDDREEPTLQEKGEAPPPVPSRVDRRSSGMSPSIPARAAPAASVHQDTHAPVGSMPADEEMAPAVPSRSERRTSTKSPPPPHPSRTASQDTMTGRPTFQSQLSSADFVMVEEGSSEPESGDYEEVEAPPPPPTRSVRAPPSRPPPHPTSEQGESQWELPSVPSASMELGFEDLSSSGFSEDSTSYPPPPPSKTPPLVSAPPHPPATRAIPDQMSGDDLMSAWGRVGTMVSNVAIEFQEKSKKTVIGDGTFAGFVDAVLSEVPNALKPSSPDLTYGYLIYAQAGAAVQRRASDIMPGDIMVMHDAKLKGHKGLQSYQQHVGANEPCVGVVADVEPKKSKVRLLQANQHVSQQSVETVSYRLEDLKSGTVKIYRVIEA